jgi:hypothetical protein
MQLAGCVLGWAALRDCCIAEVGLHRSLAVNLAFLCDDFN